MSAYPPVTRIPAIFNPTIYGVDGTEDYLTLGQADNRYLKLTGGVVSGQLTINNDLSADDLFVNDGSVSNPSISFRDDTDTGLYSSTNGVIDFTNNNNNSLTLTQTELVSRNRVLLQDGSLGNPSLAFFNQQDVGLYRSQINRLDFAVNGNTPLSLRSNDTYILGDIHIPTGAVNGYVLTSNGSGKGTWQAVSVPSSISLIDGSVSSPSLNFLNSTTTGIFRVAADVIGVSISGAERVRLPTQGIRLTCPNSYADNRFIYTQWDDGSNDHSIGFEFDYFAGSGDPTNLNHSRLMVVANNVVGEEIYDAGKKTLSIFYSDGRFQTFNTSGQIKCELHPSNGIYNYGDNTNEYVRIRHDGNNGIIYWKTGNLYINNDTTEVARFTTAKSLLFADNLNVPNIYLWTGGITTNYYAMGVKSGTMVFTGGSTAINYDFRMGATNQTDIGSGPLIGRISNTGIYSVNGSATSPSLSFLNATNTGFYYTTSPTATIGMAIGGAKIIEYTANGFYFYFSGGIRMKFEFGTGIWHYGNTTSKYIYMQHDSSNAVIRWNTGSIFVQRLGSTAGVVLGPSSTAWASASDRRLKKNIQEVEPVLEKLKHIKSYKYSLNCEECPDNKPTKYGFMADEVEPYFPEVIETIDTTENTKALRYTEMVPILCKGIVELDVKCVSLENEVSELRTENETLKSKVSTLETTLQSVLERLTILEQQQQQSTNI